MDRMLTSEEIIMIGKRLKELREKLGITQQEFADKLFCDVASYQKIESGETLMTEENTVGVHRDYIVDLNGLITGDSVGNEDAITHMLISFSKQDNVGMVFRLLEYLIRLTTRDQ